VAACTKSKEAMKEEGKGTTTMNKRSISRKRVHGEVEHNDGEFAEIQTMGIEGIEKDLLLETIQVHRCDTDDSGEQFRDRYPVGSWLDIRTTIEVRRLESDTDALEEGTATSERQLLQ
jgi:hypothetical protein